MYLDSFNAKYSAPQQGDQLDNFGYGLAFTTKLINGSDWVECILATQPTNPTHSTSICLSNPNLTHQLWVQVDISNPINEWVGLDWIYTLSKVQQRHPMPYHRMNKIQCLILLPLAEQLYKGPGSPLMVYESETLGPAPICRA